MRKGFLFIFIFQSLMNLSAIINYFNLKTDIKFQSGSYYFIAKHYPTSTTWLIFEGINSFNFISFQFKNNVNDVYKNLLIKPELLLKLFLTNILLLFNQI